MTNPRDAILEACRAFFRVEHAAKPFEPGKTAIPPASAPPLSASS